MRRNHFFERQIHFQARPNDFFMERNRFFERRNDFFMRPSDFFPRRNDFSMRPNDYFRPAGVYERMKKEVKQGNFISRRGAEARRTEMPICDPLPLNMGNHHSRMPKIPFPRGFVLLTCKPSGFNHYGGWWFSLPGTKGLVLGLLRYVSQDGTKSRSTANEVSQLLSENP
jgi:hypothetical protein